MGKYEEYLTNIEDELTSKTEAFRTGDHNTKFQVVEDALQSSAVAVFPLERRIAQNRHKSVLQLGLLKQKDKLRKFLVKADYQCMDVMLKDRDPITLMICSSSVVVITAAICR